jgi:hypothetical protein
MKPARDEQFHLRMLKQKVLKMLTVGTPQCMLQLSHVLPTLVELTSTGETKPKLKSHGGGICRSFFK